MSDKKYISLWKAISKKGNPYLSGKDKESGLKYFVFKDQDDPSIRTVLTKPIGDNDSKFTEVMKLELRTKKDSEDTYHAAGNYWLGANSRYYDNDDDAAKGGVRFLTKKDGSTVLGYDGDPLERNSHVLIISAQ